MNASTSHLYRPASIIVAPGTRGTMDGFAAVVVRHYDGNMYEIRTPGGVSCSGIYDFKPANPTQEFTAQVAAYLKKCA